LRKADRARSLTSGTLLQVQRSSLTMCAVIGVIRRPDGAQAQVSGPPRPPSAGRRRRRGASKGVRVRLAGGKFTVTEGPFAETKGLIVGYAIIQVKSNEEAIEQASAS
jgi:hypothetical protein